MNDHRYDGIIGDMDSAIVQIAQAKETLGQGGCYHLSQAAELIRRAVGELERVERKLNRAMDGKLYPEI